MRSQPPTFATWSLEHCRFGANSDSLIGDLMEEYWHGRSRAWYWRQVFAALILNFGRELYDHPLLAIRTVATVSSVWYLYGLVFSLSVHKLLIPSPTFDFIWLIVKCAIWVCGGWVVGRLHRKHKMAMVFVFAVSVLFWKLPWFVTLLGDTFSDVRYGPYVLNESLNLIVTFVSITLGGIWSTGVDTLHSDSNAKCTAAASSIAERLS